MIKFYINNTPIIYTIIFLFYIQSSNCQDIFQKTISGVENSTSYTLTKTIDDGILLAGIIDNSLLGGDDIILVKLDISGNIQWSKIYGGSNDELPRAIVQTNDYGFIVLGSTYSFGFGNEDIYLFKTDSSGNLLWSKVYGGNSEDRGFSISQTSEGGFIIGGTTSSYGAGQRDAYIIKTNNLGIIQWSKVFGSYGLDNCFNIHQTTDEGFIFTGTEESYGPGIHSLFLVKLFNNGNIEWSKAIGGGSEEHARIVLQTIDNGYILLGHTKSWGAGNWDIMVVKTNNIGSLQWAKTYGGSGEDYLGNIIKTNDGGYAICGSTTSYGVGPRDLFIIKITDFGNLLWAKTYGGSESESIPFGGDDAMLQMLNGGFLLTGQTNSFSDNDEIYIIKTDDEGYSGCNETNYTPTIQSIIPTIINVNLNISTANYSSNTNSMSSNFISNDSTLCGLLPLEAQFIASDTIICVNQCINFYDQSFYNPTNWKWYFEGGTPNISLIQNPENICYDSPGKFDVKLIVSNNYLTDSILYSDKITVNLNPNLFLGNDTLICSNGAFILTPGSGFSNYLWQNGSTDSSLLITSGGLYWVTVTNEFGCTATDSIYISLLPSPEVNLGNDTLICQGNELLLNAGSGFSSYLWNDGSTNSTYLVDTTGVFWVEVSNEFECTSIDSIVVTFYPIAFEELDLGPDTSFCESTGYILNAGSGYTYYQWQDGSNDSIFVVDTSGLYYVYVENPCSFGYDSVYLEVFPNSEIDLGNDTTVCSGSVILLDPGFGFLSYLWQDGSLNQFYSAGQSGMFWVEVIDNNNCPAFDTISIDFISPDPDIGNDTVICTGNFVTFYATGGFVNYSWQDGSGLTYFTSGTPGTYWCEVTDTMGCIGSDSVNLEVNYPPIIALGNDTSFCSGEDFWLNVSIPDSSSSFQWQDGSTDSSYKVNESGYYWVSAMNDCGSTSDSVHIAINPLPFVFIGYDTIIGVDDKILLDAGSGFEEYQWPDGSGLQTYLVNEAGTYWVNVFDGICYNSDTIRIEPVDCDLFIPIAITPNGDLFNEYFYAQASEDIYDFHLSVFTRWGEMIWETFEKEGKWDGTHNGQNAAEGSYFWIAAYKCIGAPQEFLKKGSVTLLR